MSDRWGAAARATAAGAWPAVAALVVAALALATRGAFWPGLFWDDGVYLIGARALALGEGYRFTHLSGAPAAVHFPPLWPALLAVVWKLAPAWPASVSWFNTINPLLLALAAALATWWGERRLGLPRAVAAVTAIVATASLPLLVVAQVLFSEPLFLVLLLGALLLTDRAGASGRVRDGVLAGVAVGAAMLTRTAGVTLLPAVVLALVVARQRKAALAAAAAAVIVVAPWQLWVAAHAAELAPALRGSYGPYLDWVLRLYQERGAGFAGTVAMRNTVSLFRTAGVILFPAGPRDARPLLVAFALAGVALGAVAAGRRAVASVTFLFLYASVVLPWPYAPERFLWAVWPLVLLLVARGALEAVRMARREGHALFTRAAPATLAAALIAALTGHAWYSARGVSRHWWDSAARRNAEVLAPVVAWVATHTEPSDIVACDGEPYVHLATGRRVSPVHILSPDEYLAGTPLEQAAADLRALIATSRPQWVVLSAAAAERAAAELIDGRDGGPRLQRVDELAGGGAAYRVVLP